MKVLAGRLPKVELALLSYSIKNVDFSFTPHALERALEKGLNGEEIRNCVKIGKIIELHDEQGTIRCLIRDGIGVCVVVDLSTRGIITAYKNTISDNHFTLRREEYYWGPITRQIVRSLTQVKFNRVGL